MKQAADIADPYRRTRRDHATETAEDYVEAIARLLADRGVCRVVDLARCFDVSHVTVTKIVARLKENDLVVSEPYKSLELTEAGELLAAEARERHEIVYQFLLAHGISRAVAATDSEGIEHHVSPETLRAMRLYVDASRKTG